MAVNLDSIRKQMQESGSDKFDVISFLGKESGRQVVKAGVTCKCPDNTRNCGTVTVAQGLWIVDHLEQFKASLVRAYGIQSDPAEFERLKKAAAEKAAAKESKTSTESLDERIAALQRS